MKIVDELSFMNQESLLFGQWLTKKHFSTVFEIECIQIGLLVLFRISSLSLILIVWAKSSEYSGSTDLSLSSGYWILSKNRIRMEYWILH